MKFKPKIYSCLKAIRQQILKVRKPKAPKPVKKNTLSRRMRAFVLRLDRRQQERHLIDVQMDGTERACSNCSTVYNGRVCPQCGQVGVWSRFTWRQTILNFLDIWGLGNRPMYRTLKDLFWRPGYMARDYLNGQRQYYFPPFKLLALTLALYLSVMFLTNSQYKPRADILSSMLDNSKLGEMTLSPVLESMVNGFLQFIDFVASHPLYDLLFFVFFLVCGVRIAFHRVREYNFVETFIFLVFVMSQLNIYHTIETIGQYVYANLNNYFFTAQIMSSSVVMAALGSLTSTVCSLVSKVFSLGIGLLVLTDFHQFYGLPLKSLFLRFVISVVIVLGGVSAIVIIIVISAKTGPSWGVMSLAVLVMSCFSYYFVEKYLHDNKPKTNNTIYKSSKWMLIVLLCVMPILTNDVEERLIDGHNVLMTLLIAVLITAASVAFVLVPTVIYRRFHRTWLALSPFVILIVILYKIIEL